MPNGKVNFHYPVLDCVGGDVKPCSILKTARLMAGRVTTLWVKRPLTVNQHGQLSQPSLRGRLNE